jgi:integrase
MTTATRSPTADAFAASWAENYPRPDDSTNATNRSAIKVFAREFAGLPLDQITRAQAREFATKHPHHARVARTCLNDAMGDDLTASNPFEGLRVRGRSKGRKDVLPPTEDDVARLVEAAYDQGPWLGSMIRFAAYTGVRLGEQLALTYDDIDGDRCQITRQIKPDGRVKEPKTGRTRVIWVPPAAGFGPVEGADGLRIWDLSRGQHFRRWAKVREACGMPDCDWHQLRHHAATWLMDKGASPEDISIQLGHTDGGILVRKLYGHPDPELALERLAKAAA